MRGSVWERYPGSWWIKFDIGRDADGKRQRVQTNKDAHGNKLRTQKEAQRALTDAMARHNSGSYVVPSSQTLNQFLEDEWLPAINGKIKRSTYVSYERTVRIHIGPNLGSVKMTDLARSAARITGFYTYLLTEGRADGKGGLSPKSVRNCHIVLRSALQHAVRHDRISRNVAALVSPAEAIADAAKTTDTAKPRTMKTWTADQLGSFLSSIRDHPFYVPIYLAANTGMRRGEVLGLCWNDVHLEEGLLSVRQTLLSVDYKLVFDTPKSTKSKRPISLDAETVSLLRVHRRIQKEQRLSMGMKVDDNDLVFARADGEPIHPDAFSDAFEKVVKRSGLPRLTCHDLRHTHASLALRAGIHPKIVQERLGHASIQITLDTYSHLIPSLDKDAAELIANLIPRTPLAEDNQERGV